MLPAAIPGTELAYHPSFLATKTANEAFERLIDEIPWSSSTIRMFGREIPVPRRISWHGDPGASYRYSGLCLEPRPWTPTLSAIRDQLRETLGLDFNAVLANLYRDGSDSMGWHSDDEPELGPEPSIASVSLGGTRRFAMRARDDDTKPARFHVHLEHGSLLTMAGKSQARWQHALPKTKAAVAPRINLTFRTIVRTR